MTDYPKTATPQQEAEQALLEVSNLSVSFRMYRKGTKQRQLKVISDLSFTAHRGEVLAIVGSSGSGKSLLAHAIMGLLPDNATVTGDLRYNGSPLDSRAQERLRGSEIALVPQSVTYLDPLMKVGRQVRGVNPGSQTHARQRSVFDQLELTGETESLYPFQLSGGMARRVLFSTAAVTDPELVIADEPTPGMHGSQAVEALSILRELADSGKTVLLITHDIDLGVRFADRMAVFYAGTTVEVLPSADFLDGVERLRHPYTKALWRAMPQNNFDPIDGQQPYAGELPPGCLFAPRCPLRTEECETGNPPMRELRGAQVRCIHAT